MFPTPPWIPFTPNYDVFVMLECGDASGTNPVILESPDNPHT
jgi:hypothetical protein